MDLQTAYASCRPFRYKGTNAWYPAKDKSEKYSSYTIDCDHIDGQDWEVDEPDIKVSRQDLFDIFNLGKEWKSDGKEVEHTLRAKLNFLYNKKPTK